MVHIVETLSYIYGIFRFERFESRSDLLTLLKNIYVNIARSYHAPGDRIVPPPWRGAGRFVAWLSTSASNYSKAGSCLWSAAPVEGILMITFNLQLPTFFLANFAFNGHGSRGDREVCTSRKSRHYWRCFLIRWWWQNFLSGRLRSGHLRWKEKNRFIFSPVSLIIGLQVLTRDALAAGLAACSTYANMFPPASALRSMPSSLPNGSASVEPTPRWPVVGTLMGGRENQRQPSFPTTHRAFPTTHNTQHTTTHNPQNTTHNTQCITHNTQLTHSLTVLEHTYTHTNSPTITAPSLLYFLFPSCFSMPSLNLEKLVSCGVIRSFNWGFWGFQFTMQFTRWTAVLRLLRFSVSIALTRRLRFFCPTGTRDTIILLEGVPKQVATKGPVIIPPKALRILVRICSQVPAKVQSALLVACVRSLEGRREGESKNKQRIKRPKQNWAVRRPIVTKRSTANANAEKSIPPAMSQQNQHLTHATLRKPATTTPKQFQTT